MLVDNTHTQNLLSFASTLRQERLVEQEQEVLFQHRKIQDEQLSILTEQREIQRTQAATLDGMKKQQDDIAALYQETDAAVKEMRTDSKWIKRLTWVLVVLTIVLAIPAIRDLIELGQHVCSWFK